MSDSQTFPASDPLGSAQKTLDLVTEAAQRGATDAKEAAVRTLDTAARFLNRFVYTTCYSVSYGLVFPAVLVARAIPRDNAAVRGLIEGADAARKKVDELYLSTPETTAVAALPA